MRVGLLIVAGMCAWAGVVRAQVTFSVIDSADAFLATGSPNNPDGTNLTGLNYGGAGTLCVSPANALKGEFQSVIRFDLTGATNQFNAAYGSNLWTIGGISLRLTSNYGTAGVQPNNPIFNTVSGGKFVIEWLAADDWIEGNGNPSSPTMDGITYNSLPGLLAEPRAILGTYNYVPPGNNVPVTWTLPLNPSLVADVAQGGLVSFRFYAADNQVGYLFNSYFYGRGNEPLITVTANPWLQITTAYFTNGAFHLEGVAPANLGFQIQSSTNLANPGWQTLGTLTADLNNSWRFDDATVAGTRQRFYRLLK